MIVPNLDPINRSGEYKNYKENQRDKIIYYYLFVKGMTNRNMDEQILGLNSIESKGYQSMGILHYIGMGIHHKGIFIDNSIDDAINMIIGQNEAHFKPVIDSLKRYQKITTMNQIFDSWELVDTKIAVKTVDKSVFAHFGVSIPMRSLSVFFGVDKLEKNDRKTITLIYDNNNYMATIEIDILHNSISKIMWNADFRDLLKSEMFTYYNIFINDTVHNDIKWPKIRFSKINDIQFEVTFIYVTEIENDNREEVEEGEGHTNKTELTNIESNVRKEGKVKYVYGKQYERDPNNRIEAIKFHGTKCVVCGFDFEKFYGARGKGYIEIHHIKPLSSIGKEIDINPKMDLVPVCSNCHKMIHRRKDKVLSINEMKNLLINKK